MKPTPSLQRLQKVLAAAGVGSRRECETVITNGRVEIDRQVVTTLGTKVSPHQEIRVDGSILARTKLVYYVLNKPVGVVSTARDPSGRQRVIDLVESRERLFPVGRLDKESEGLMLLTNDGELANRITHPRYGLEKTYHVQVAGLITRETIGLLHKGIHLAEAYVQIRRVKIKSRHKKSTILEMVLDEGRNREIRRMLARLKHKVQWLRRIAIGPLRLGTLASGQSRPLLPRELKALRTATADKPAAAGSADSTDQKNTKSRPYKKKVIRTPKSSADWRSKKSGAGSTGDRNKKKYTKKTSSKRDDNKRSKSSESSSRISPKKTTTKKSSTTTGRRSRGNDQTAVIKKKIAAKKASPKGRRSRGDEKKITTKKKFAQKPLKKKPTKKKTASKGKAVGKKNTTRKVNKKGRKK